MKFKKYSEKKLSNEETLDSFQVRSAKIIFLFAAPFFFINIFLLGSDQNNEYNFLQKILPVTYTLFIAAIMFLWLAGVKYFTKVKYKNLTHMLSIIIIVIFSIPLLVFFIGRADIISNL